jgi:hypothetical protein
MFLWNLECEGDLSLAFRKLIAERVMEKNKFSPKIKTEKLIQKFAQLKDNQYICRIKIEDL